MDALPDSPPEEIQKVVFKVLRCVSVFITFYPFPSREITRFFFWTCDNVECRHARFAHWFGTPLGFEGCVNFAGIIHLDIFLFLRSWIWLIPDKVGEYVHFLDDADREWVSIEPVQAMCPARKESDSDSDAREAESQGEKCTFPTTYNILYIHYTVLGPGINI